MPDGPSGLAVVDQLRQAGVRYIISVPGRTTSVIVEAAQRDPFFRVISVCREDEGVSICCGLSFGEKRAALITQHTGLLDSVNSVRAVGSELRRPLVMLIGQLKKEEGLKPPESKRFGVRIAEPVLDILEIPHLLVERRGEESGIAALIDQAYAAERPLAVLFGTEVEPQ